MSRPSNIGRFAPDTVSKVDDITGFYQFNGYEGQQVSLASWHAGLNKGGGTFVWDSTGDKADHNGGTVIDPDIQYTTVATYLAASGTGTGVWRRLGVDSSNVEDFGANPNIADSYPSIQAAIDYSNQTYTGTNFALPVIFGAGVYLCSQGLVSDLSGSQVSFIGEGFRKTVLKATAVMTSMLSFGDTGFQGNRDVRGITFDGDNLADTIIDCKEDRYFNIEYNEFKNFLVSGVIINQYTIKILNNYFFGNNSLGSSENSTVIGLLCGKIGAALNDVIISRNTFHKCGVGVKLQAGSNDINIIQNSFDTCTQTGVYGVVGAGNLAIKGNYFERCGKTLDGANTTVPLLYPTDSSPMYGAVILHEQTGSESTGYDSVQINDSNTFRNTNTNAVMTLSNVFDFVYEGNDYDETYPSDLLIKLIGQGTGFVTRSKRFKAESVVVNITKLIDWSLTDSNPYQNGYLNNIQVVPITKGENLSSQGLLVINDPVTFKGAGQTINESQYGKTKRWEFLNPRALDNTFSIDITENPELLGRYVRIVFGAKTQSANVGGLTVASVHDGVKQTTTSEQFTASNASASGYKYLRSGIWYIPTTLTTSWGVNVLQSLNEPIDVVNFAIFDAAVDVRQTPVVKQFYS